MSPSILKPEPGFAVIPMKKTGDDKTDFGAVIPDLDLNDISGKFTLSHQIITIL